MAKNSRKDCSAQAEKYASQIAEEIEEDGCGNFETVAEEAFKAGWKASEMARALLASKPFAESLAYVRSWAETTTNEEMPGQPGDAAIKCLDYHIRRARKLLKKHNIPFQDPSDGDDE